jgi:hypothetical protein
MVKFQTCLSILSWRNVPYVKENRNIREWAIAHSSESIKNMENISKCLWMTCMCNSYLILEAKIPTFLSIEKIEKNSFISFCFSSIAFKES